MSSRKRKASKKDEDETLHEPLGEVATLETGHVIFFYRIKVDTQGEATGSKDVQKLFLLLMPEGGKGTNRLLVVPHKSFPDSHKPVWSFVDDASNDIHKLDQDLAEYHYSTATKGERVLKGARICGEGIYSFIVHRKPRLSVSKERLSKARARPQGKGKEKEAPTTGAIDTHVHFAYVLELPETPGHVQESFHIEKEGNFLVTVKNPEASNPPNAGLPSNEKPSLPSQLQEKFAGKRFIPLDPPDFLNYKGTEILFIATKKHISDDLGIEGEKLKDQAELEEHEGIHGCGVSPEQIFKDLKMSKSEQKEHPTQALTTGEFK